MATSTVARRSMPSFLSTLMLLGVAYAQTVQPSNSSTVGEVMNQMRLTGGPLFQQQQPYNILPLTPHVGQNSPNPNSVTVLTFTGPLKIADPQSSMNLTTSDIAYISCDSDGSNIDPSTVLANAATLHPKVIVLYSLQFNECNATNPPFQTLYSMTSAADSQEVYNTIGLYPSTAGDTLLQAMIGTNTTTGAGASPTSDNNQGGPAPTTAVAMSILYSITGIITLLFLIIIATGAVRAHRHPERYGPRNGYAGRPRQSRAKGLARAMLETLPIVKFGDPEPVKPGSREVELENGSTHTAPTETTPQQEGTTTAQSKSPPVEATAVASGMGAAQEGTTKDGAEAAAATTPPKEGELGCSICTEDFTTGEDVRVLPCHHKYHPACIDPWLLNVSGTCPLCRHDLRPETSAGSNHATEGRASSDLPPPLNVEGEGENAESSEDAATHQRRRRSRFLDLSRLRTAPPEERIAALRELREQSRTEELVEDVEEQQSRRARLTGRLRDTFRIRTRAQNVPPGASSQQIAIS